MTTPYHALNPNADENPYAEEEAYQQTRALIAAAERMTPDQLETLDHTDPDGYDDRAATYRTCRRCRQTGYAGAYPFSTYGGDVDYERNDIKYATCDDCGA